MLPNIFLSVLCIIRSIKTHLHSAKCYEMKKSC